MTPTLDYQDTGETPITQADDLNVPVNSFLLEPDMDEPLWRWVADSFQPRRSRIADAQFEIKAATKEILISVVQERVVPLYAAALHNLTTRGENYFWAKKETST